MTVTDLSFTDCTGKQGCLFECCFYFFESLILNFGGIRQKWHSITGWWKSIWETAADQQSHDTTSEVEGERKREQENTAIANHNNNIAQRLLIFENDASDCICSSHYEIDEENMT